MSIIGVLVTIVIIGFLLWLARTYIPMDPKISNVLSAVVALLVILWLLSIFVGFGPMYAPGPHVYVR